MFMGIDQRCCPFPVFYQQHLICFRFNWHSMNADVHFYPLRPELAESTYLLYRATKNPFYLHVGKEILHSLNTYSKAKCGYATIHDVHDKSLEDRMESFFLSETCKYLYLLFDFENPLNTPGYSSYIFTTEGHIFPIIKDLRTAVEGTYEPEDFFDGDFSPKSNRAVFSSYNNSSAGCVRVDNERQYLLPLKHEYLTQVSTSLGLDISLGSEDVLME